MSKDTKCPFHHAAGGGTSNKDWWPNQLRVDLLNQHSNKSNPLGENSTTPKNSTSSITKQSRRT